MAHLAEQRGELTVAGAAQGGGPRGIRGLVEVLPRQQCLPLSGIRAGQRGSAEVGCGPLVDKPLDRGAVGDDQGVKPTGVADLVLAHRGQRDVDLELGPPAGHRGQDVPGEQVIVGQPDQQASPGVIAGAAAQTAVCPRPWRS